MENIKRLTLHPIFGYMFIRKLPILALLFCLNSISAQEKLIVLGGANDLYILHSVGEKESLSSIGRLYNLVPRQLAAYNRINSNDVLPMNAKLKIPLIPTNFLSEPENESSEPVYHIAEKGDNLFQLSKRYNNVKLTSLRKWNDLTTDAVKNGQAIIVGYIGGGKTIGATTTPMANTFVNAPIVYAPGSAPQTPLQNPNVLDASKDGSRELKGTLKPLTDDEIFFLRMSEAKAKKAAEAAGVIVPDPLPVNDFKALSQEPVTDVKIPEEDIVYVPQPNDEGYFGLVYSTYKDESAEEKNMSGNASIFKTLSGVSDRKFYVLMNNVLPGTIVRISTTNKKSICARVLGALPESKSQPDLILRMSNAAAAALNMPNQTFAVTLTYKQ
jgi:LysM repeat protein